MMTIPLRPAITNSSALALLVLPVPILKLLSRLLNNASPVGAEQLPLLLPLLAHCMATSLLLLLLLCAPAKPPTPGKPMQSHMGTARPRSSVKCVT
jgi:hypothetical protein